MGKSTDVQSVFGYGNCRSASDAGGLLKTGTLNDKGQFFGYNNSSSQVKVFHIEKPWGDQWDRTAGVIYNSGQIWMKMTPEEQGYRINDVIGYTNTGVSISGSSGGYISKGTCSEYGFLPTTVSGSGSTYYADGCWFDGSGLRYGFVAPAWTTLRRLVVALRSLWSTRRPGRAGTTAAAFLASNLRLRKQSLRGPGGYFPR